MEMMRKPKIVKLDGRYKFYNRGYKYRIEFDVAPWMQGGWDSWIRSVRWCEKIYGPERELIHELRLKFNDNYRLATPKKSKHSRHLYLREEQDLSMLLLSTAGAD